jgi:hypothetical protein
LPIEHRFVRAPVTVTSECSLLTPRVLVGMSRGKRRGEGKEFFMIGTFLEKFNGI